MSDHDSFLQSAHLTDHEISRQVQITLAREVERLAADDVDLAELLGRCLYSAAREFDMHLRETLRPLRRTVLILCVFVGVLFGGAVGVLLGLLIA